MKRIFEYIAPIVLTILIVASCGNGQNVGSSGGGVGKPDNGIDTGNNFSSSDPAPITARTDESQATAGTTSASSPRVGTSATVTTAEDPPLSAFGAATIDGIMSAGEWNNAVRIDFQANLSQHDGGGTTPATVHVMNDTSNIYFAVRIARPSLGGAVSAFLEFDSDGDCIREDGDDVFGVSGGRYSPVEFADDFRYTCPGSLPGTAGCAPRDTDALTGYPAPGTNDGSGAMTNDGMYTIIELSHPLNSGDSVHDFGLGAGDSVNFFTSLRLFSLDTTCNEGPDCYADTDYPGWGVFCSDSVGKITIAPPPETPLVSPGVIAAIDIKPGSFENSINPKSNGKIPVALLSAPGFDALTAVDVTSLAFGKTGDEQSLAFCNESGEDVNNDGLPDLLCHFFTQRTEFRPGDVEGILKGRTEEGDYFTGKDSVRVVPPEH